MYQANAQWTVDCVDWRQVAIMIYAFMNSITSKDYHSKEPQPKSEFLKSLYVNGKYVENLRVSWIPGDDVQSIHP